MDLIDRDKLLRDIEKFHLSDGKFQHWVEVQPSVEPNRGEWLCNENNGWDDDVYMCSACKEEWICPEGTPLENDMNFCPHCGADMRPERKI